MISIFLHAVVVKQLNFSFSMFIKESKSVLSGLVHLEMLESPIEKLEVEPPNPRAWRHSHGVLKVGRLEMASPVVVVVVVARMECFWCGVNSFSIFFRLAHRRQTYCF